MAASSKFDLSSSSSDGPPAHPSGQRIAASLERPGSFREVAENRIASSLPSSSASRAGSMSSQGDAVSLLQTLVSDMKPVVAFDQKLPRPGELRRLISSILGISQEDPLPATFPIRPLPSSSMEEIRRLRNNVQEGYAKARYILFLTLSGMQLKEKYCKDDCLFEGCLNPPLPFKIHCHST